MDKMGKHMEVGLTTSIRELRVDSWGSRGSEVRLFHIRMHILVHVRTHILTHIHIPRHIHMHTHTHTHTHKRLISLKRDW